MASNTNLDFNKIEEAKNVNLVDELEEAFQSCIQALTKEESGYGDDSLKHEQTVEQTTSKFIDLARQIEVFFLQKRFLVLNTSPELMLKEENSELRHEIGRKDELLRKHFDKIDAWKQLLQLQDNQPQQRPQQIGPPGSMPGDIRVGGGVGVGGVGVGPPPGMMPQPPNPAAAAAAMMMGQPPMMPQQPMLGGHMGGPPGVAQPPTNPQMFVHQPQMRPSYNQGPLDYLLKTTNNIDSVGMGDGRR